jgi:hypothetical protein
MVEEKKALAGCMVGLLGDITHGFEEWRVNFNKGGAVRRLSAPQ